MYTAVIILIIIDALLLGIVVLLQNSKGGGLASEFSSSNQIMGVRKTADFLEKATWTLAIILVVLSFATSFIGGRAVTSGEQENVSKAQSGQSMSAPAPMPQPAASAEGEIPAEPVAE
ncbi:MAG: preprotein translocase subunit SecG [Bacteroidales bacterium]|nr:preprotein translocase subunit SecG [Bacteroidales bacterium]